MKYSFSRLIGCVALLGVTTGALAGYRLAAQDSSQKTDDHVYELRNAGDFGITAPKATYRPFPEYTDKARRKKIQGVVVVGVVVNPDGTVRDASVVKSLEPGLGQTGYCGGEKMEISARHERWQTSGSANHRRNGFPSALRLVHSGTAGIPD